MKLSIVAIKNHPDICGVVEYLENLDLVPAQYGDLAFAMPSEDYAGNFDAPIEWYKAWRSNCVCVNPDTGMSAYVAYSKSADTIVALADVLSGTAEMPSQDEQAIALYILYLLEANGYDRKYIEVEYTNDPPAEETHYQEMMDAMVPPAVAENMARDVLLQLIPGAEIPESAEPIETEYVGGQTSYIEVQFAFAGEDFFCRFNRDYKVTDKEREDSMIVWLSGLPDEKYEITDPASARAELVKMFFNFPEYAFRHDYNGSFLEEYFKADSQSVDHDGTIEWKGTYRGNPMVIQCKDNKFSFSAPGVTGDGLTYDELAKHFENSFIPPEATREEPVKSKTYYRKVFNKAHDKWAQMDIDDGGDGSSWDDYMPETPAGVLDQDIVDAVVGYYLVYHEPTKDDPSAPYHDWLENTKGKKLTKNEKEVTRILKVLFEPDCPFCSGEDVGFGSHQFTFCRPGNGTEVNMGKDGSLVETFEWKFCPVCGREL